ncbi:MAG: TRAM domain-containing protein, partial [Firmicutes bacterium]|nr:TRAM domain-containing protein [Bacillota bacterium]
MILTKNDLVIFHIDDLGCNGEGIAHENGYTVFVPYALPGEKVRAKILKVKDSLAWARVEQILVVSGDRVEPICPVFCRCGGCA